VTQYIRHGTVGRTGAAAQWGVRDLRRRPPPPSPPPYHIKVSPDDKALTAGDGKFIFAIPVDMPGLALIDVEIDVTTAGTAVQVQIRNIDNGNVDMLSTVASIDSGETHSATAATQPVVNATNASVYHMNRISIDVDLDGGAMGLGVILYFGYPVQP